MQFHSKAAAAHPRLYPESDLISWIEPGSGLIRVMGRGQWSTAQVGVHFAALRNLLRQRRATGEPVRVMIDLRESEVQSLDTMDSISDARANLYAPEERVATIVESSTLRAQLKTVGTTENRAFFLSPTAARIWLSAVWLSPPPGRERRVVPEPSRWLMSA